MRFGRNDVLGWAVVCAMALAPAAFAQIATGNIYGTVSDESGGVLPGATVTLSGEFGTRTTTSGGEGEFRFLKVDHGTHTLTAALTGFGGVTRDVIVTIGSNIQLDFTLSVAAVEETVTVTAETPVVDSKKLGTATYVSQAELAQIPSSRDPWALMRTVPGILVDRVNVAGSESGQQAQYYGKGADPKDQNWTLDGIAVTDEVSWSSPSYWSYDTFDEMNVTTAGTDITLATGGMGINLVTKRGSNSFHGSGGGYFTHDDLQWSNLAGSGLEGDPRLQGSDKADHADQISDVSFDLGGPIIKDKLWFYAGYGRNDIRIRRLTQTGDKTVLENKTFKLNWQAGPNDMISAFWFNGAKIKIGRSASGFQEDASHTRDQGNGYVDGRPHGLSKLEWNHIFSPNFVFNTKVAYYNTGFNLTPQGGLDQREVLDAVNQLAQGSSRAWDYLRPQTTANVDANYFKGSHEIKFGVGFRRMGSQVIASTPGEGKIQITFQTSGQDEARFYRDGNSNGGTDHWSAYLGDTLTRDRLTVTAGVRYDRWTAYSSATTSEANPAIPDIMPALDYAGSEGNVAEWNVFSPRIGVTYALDEGRKTVTRASFARYGGTMGTGVGNWTNPVGSAYAVYGWADANGDRDVQLGEVDFDNLIRASGFDPANPTLVESPNRIDPDFKPNVDTEVVVGIDRELMPDLAASLAYTWRKSTDLTTDQLWSNWWWYNWTAGDDTFSSDDFVALPSVSARGYTATPYDATDAAWDRITWGLMMTNREDYSRTFNGLELSLVKRLSNKWMGRVAFSLNDWKEHVGPGAISNPTRHDWDPLDDGGQVVMYQTGSGNRYYSHARWQFSANGLYQLPYGFEVAASIFGRQGYPNPVYFAMNSGFDYLNVLPDGYSITEDRFDNLWNVDLRLAKNLSIGEDVRVTFTAELFNAFNSNTMLRQTRDVLSDQFGRVDEILAPRIARFGARVSF